MKKEEYPPYNVFVCPDCNLNNEMSRKELLIHLIEVHGMKGEHKAKRSLMMHINRKPRHASSYEYKFENGLTVYQYIG